MEPSNRQPGTTRSTFAALRERNYRLYWLGLVCYVLGHRAEYVTFSWMVWEVTHDPLYLGYLGLAAGASVGALLLYSRLRLRADPSQSAHAHMARQLLEGLSFVAHDFVFAALIGLALFNAVFGLSYVTLLPIFADWYFNAGSIGYGLLNAAHGIGAFVGTLTVATTAHLIARPGRALLVTAVGMGLALMVFSMSPAMGMALGMLVFVGFANTFYLTQVSTFIQSNVPDRLRGRVLSIYALCWNLLPLGGLIGGALAAAVDARFAVAFGGAMVAINALVLLTSKRLRALGY